MNKRQKGRAFCKKIIEILRKELDEGTYEVVGSGAGKDKGDIRVPACDLVIEAKDHKAAQVAAWTEQSEREGLGYSATALMWKHPKSPSANPEIRVDISLDYFIELLKKSKEPTIESNDREFKYKLQRLISSAKEVVRYFDK